MAPVSVFSNSRSQFIGLLPAAVQEFLHMLSNNSTSLGRYLYRIMIHRGDDLATIEGVIATVLVSMMVRKSIVARNLVFLRVIFMGLTMYVITGVVCHPLQSGDSVDLPTHLCRDSSTSQGDSQQLL